MLPFDFVIIGQPVLHRAKDRKALKAWREHVKTTAQYCWGDRPPLTDRLYIKITHFYDAVPGNMGEDLDTERIIKPVLDALNGVIYVDDYQIAELENRRRNINGSFRIKGMSPTLAEAFCRGEEFLYVRIDFSRNPQRISAVKPNTTEAKTNASKQSSHTRFCELGKVSAEIGNFEEALNNYGQALLIKSDYVEAWIGRGDVLCKLNLYEDAIRSYDEALEIDPSRYRALLQKGTSLANLKRYEEAIICYDQVLAIKPDYSEAVCEKGTALASLGHYEEAIACYDQVLSLAPDLAEVWNSRGVVLAEQDRHEEAIHSYDRTLSLDPDFARALNNRGNSLVGLGRYEEAISSYEQALELEPDVAETWNHKGKALKNLERFEETLNDFNRAIELKPYFVSAIVNRGETYRLMERYEEAISDFNRAIELDPANAWAIASRSETYRLMGRYEEALQGFTHALELDTNNIWTVVRRGHTLAGMNRYEEARQDYEHALVITRERGDLRNEAICLRNLGNTYQKLSESQQAIECFQKSLEILQEIGDVQNQAITLSSLGNVYATAEQYSRTIDAFQQALSLCKTVDDRHNESLILVDLADIYQTLVNNKQSVDVTYNQAVAADLYEQALGIAQELDNKDLETSIRSKLVQALLKLEHSEGLERAIEVAQSISDQGKRLELLTAVVDEVRRLGSDQVEELLASLRGDSDLRIRQLVSQKVLTGIRDALVVGISNYEHMPNLRSPTEDAEAIAQILGQHGNFRVKRLPEIIDQNTSSVRVGETTSVTSNQLEEALIQLFNPQDGNIPDTVLFYFSGHGIQRNRGIREGFLATSDTEPGISNWGVSLRWLRSLIQESPVRKHIIWLDCSHSGGLLNLDEISLGAIGKSCDGCFIAACSELELAFEKTGEKHSNLTQALLAGLDPARYPHGLVDNLILTSEIQHLLRNGLQTPVLANYGEPILLTSLDEAEEVDIPSIRESRSTPSIPQEKYRISLELSTERIHVGGEVEISITLDLADNGDGYLLEIPSNGIAGKDLNILLNAPGFQLENDNAASLPLDAGIHGQDDDVLNNTQAVSFRMIALRPGVSTVTTNFYQDNVFEAALENTVQVTGLEQAVLLDSGIKVEPRPVPQPDLVLRIQTSWNESASACAFHYHLKSFRTSPLLFPGVNYQSQLFPASWLTQLRKLLQNSLFPEADALFSDGHSRLVSVGRYFYQYLFPSELQLDLRDLNHYQVVTLLIQADQDAQLPWSLLHNGQEFLGERFVIGHWFGDLNHTSPYEFPVGSINFAHYANTKHPEAWAILLKPPGAPPSFMLTGGILDDLNSTEAMRGLHLLRHGQSDTEASRQDAPIPLDEAVEEQSLDHKVRPIKLNLRRNRPLVTLGYLRNSQPELTDLHQTWASTFLRASCSAFVGPLWAVNSTTEAAFISSFYHALWTGDSLGGAFHKARRMARAANPESMDWLAYCLFGDPMARPYRPVSGQGYAVVEPVAQDIADPIAPGSTVRFRVSLRRTPPVWHDERVIEVAEDLSFNDLQAHIAVSGLQVTPAASIELRPTPSGNYLGWFSLTTPADVSAESALVQVYFADGMQTIHTLSFLLTFQAAGGDS